MGTAIDRHGRLADWLTPFRLLFTRPTWQRLVVLAAGAILTTHRRTVAAVLRVIRLAGPIGLPIYQNATSSVLKLTQLSQRVAWMAKNSTGYNELDLREELRALEVD